LSKFVIFLCKTINYNLFSFFLQTYFHIISNLLKIKEINMKVLIIDDSDLIRERLISKFNIYKHIKVIGLSGKVHDIMDEIRAYDPDAIILDIHLAGENGIEILKNIKNQKRKTRVIVLTTNSNPKYRKVCMKYGADDFLDKARDFEKIPEIMLD
jgi:two-component system response regulator DevR